MLVARGEGNGAGARKLLPMVIERLAAYVTDRVIEQKHTDTYDLILYRPDRLAKAWPWGTAWEAVLSKLSDGNSGGGGKGRPSSQGTVVMVRGNHIGLGPRDYPSERSSEIVQALQEVWRSGAEGSALLAKLRDSIDKMAAAVETSTTSDRYHEAIDMASSTLESIAASSHDGVVSPQEWQRLRAVLSGALPKPNRRQEAATRERMAATGAAQPSVYGRDGERMGAMAVAAQAVVAAAQEAVVDKQDVGAVNPERSEKSPCLNQ